MIQFYTEIAFNEWNIKTFPIVCYNDLVFVDVIRKILKVLSIDIVGLLNPRYREQWSLFHFSSFPIQLFQYPDKQWSF